MNELNLNLQGCPGALSRLILTENSQKDAVDSIKIQTLKFKL